MSDVRSRLHRATLAWPLALCLVVSAGVSALAADEADPSAGSLALIVSGVETGATVSQPLLTLVVEPVGFDLGGSPASGTGPDHLHVRVDGVLSGMYGEHELVVDLSRLEPGWHTLTFLPATSDHVEVAAGATALEIDYQPGAAGESVEPAGEAATEVAVALREWSLEPSELELTAGTYTFVVSNDGSIDHSLVISGDGISAGTPDAEFGPGVTESFSVDLVPGTYEMLCPLPWHKTTGMTGTIVVSS